MHSLRTFFITICTVYLIGIAQPGVADESIVVVTHRSSTLKSVSFETLKLVYLRKSLLDSNSNRWIPLNYPSSHELRQAFSLALFKILPEDQDEYWNEQYFHGINPPHVLASEEAVLRFVAMTPGAIGYVRKRNVDDRVKVLLNLSISVHN
jgi:hypothetical protein